LCFLSPLDKIGFEICFCRQFLRVFPELFGL
jgi:hypothetical protein